MNFFSLTLITVRNKISFFPPYIHVPIYRTVTVSTFCKYIIQAISFIFTDDDFPLVIFSCVPFILLRTSVLHNLPPCIIFNIYNLRGVPTSIFITGVISSYSPQDCSPCLNHSVRQPAPAQQYFPLIPLQPPAPAPVSQQYFSLTPLQSPATAPDQRTEWTTTQQNPSDLFNYSSRRADLCSCFLLCRRWSPVCSSIRQLDDHHHPKCPIARERDTFGCDAKSRMR